VIVTVVVIEVRLYDNRWAMKNGRDQEACVSVYVGLGSNLGDRLSNLRQALERLKELDVEVTVASSIYETEPVGYSAQPWFLNQVVEARVHPAQPLPVQAESLLSDLLKIEVAMGRERTVPGGPRVIDLDLLLYGDAIIGHPSRNNESPQAGRPPLTVPHPRMHQRRFVLAPLSEIAPNLIHPVLGKTSRELLVEVGDPFQIRVFAGSGRQAR
jgi:2-amino-4-hydroxy-6-hydroxymethyldihydropteridine diphosphokinase